MFSVSEALQFVSEALLYPGIYTLKIYSAFSCSSPSCIFPCMKPEIDSAAAPPPQLLKSIQKGSPKSMRKQNSLYQGTESMTKRETRA